MKKAMLVLGSIFITLNILGADEKYYQKMDETLTGFRTCRTLEDFQGLANQFRTIANVETTEWMPLYYEAHCYILMSFMDGSGGMAKDAWLDQAENSIKKMIDMAPQESEVYALEALYHTGRLVINPPERAQTTTPLINTAIGKSLSLDGNNPRAKFMRLSNDIGTARFFGSDTTPYCDDARELLEHWDSYKVKSPIHPSWGKNQVEEIVSGCGE